MEKNEPIIRVSNLVKKFGDFVANDNYKLYRTDICNFESLEKIFAETKLMS